MSTGPALPTDLLLRHGGVKLRLHPVQPALHHRQLLLHHLPLAGGAAQLRLRLAQLLDLGLHHLAGRGGADTGVCVGVGGWVARGGVLVFVFCVVCGVDGGGIRQRPTLQMARAPPTGSVCSLLPDDALLPAATCQTV